MTELQQTTIPINEFFEFLIEFEISINLSGGGDDGQVIVDFCKEIPTTHKYFNLKSFIIDKLEYIFNQYLFSQYDVPIDGNIDSSGTVTIHKLEDSETESKYYFNFELEVSDEENCDTVHKIDISDFLLKNHIDSISYAHYYGDRSEEDIHVFLPICLDLNGENPELKESYNDYILNEQHDLILILNNIIDKEIEEHISDDDLDSIKYYLYEYNYRTDLTKGRIDDTIIYIDKATLTNESHEILIEEIFDIEDNESVVYDENKGITHLIF